jgi:hypothetical protein
MHPSQVHGLRIAYKLAICSRKNAPTEIRQPNDSYITVDFMALMTYNCMIDACAAKQPFNQSISLHNSDQLLMGCVGCLSCGLII